MKTDISLADLGMEGFIEGQAPGLLPYMRKWVELIGRLYGFEFIPLVATDGTGRVSGFLPLCSLQSPLTGRRLVCLPFLDTFPLLATDKASANTLIDQAVDLAKEYRVRYLELRSGFCEALAGRADFVQEDRLYVRWLMPLSADPQQVWSGLRKPVQRQVQKAQKMGVHVRIARSREEVEQYYRLHLRTRTRKHGMPAQPRAYFMGLWDAYAASGSVQFLLAEYEGLPIAGMVLLAFGETIRYAYGASDERYLRLAPNNLLMWRAIELGCTLGYHTLDMGRTSRDNEGLMEFKRRWGAVEEALPYYYYPAVAGLASTSETSLRFRILTSSWRHLPLGLAGVLGGRLYKHLG